MRAYTPYGRPRQRAHHTRANTLAAAASFRNRCIAVAWGEQAQKMYEIYRHKLLSQMGHPNRDLKPIN